MNRCPFCSGRAEVRDEFRDGRRRYFGMCWHCDAQGPETTDKAVAGLLWDNRSEGAAPNVCPWCRGVKRTRGDCSDGCLWFETCDTCGATGPTVELEGDLETEPPQERFDAAWMRRATPRRLG